MIYKIEYVQITQFRNYYTKLVETKGRTGQIKIF